MAAKFKGEKCDPDKNPWSSYLTVDPEKEGLWYLEGVYDSDLGKSNYSIVFATEDSVEKVEQLEGGYTSGMFGMLDTPAFVYVSGVGGTPWDADYYEMKALTKDGIQTIVANMSTLGPGVYNDCKYAQFVGTTEESGVIFKCNRDWEKEGDLDKLFLIPLEKEPELLKEAEFQKMVVKGSTLYWGEYGVNGSEVFKCSISSSSPHSNCDMTTSSLGLLPKNTWGFYISPSDEIVVTPWLAYDQELETSFYEVALAIPLFTPLFNVTGINGFQFIEVPDMPTVDDPVDGKDDGPPPPPPPPSSDLTFTSGQAKAILDEFDSDGDGQLNYGELTGEK